MPIYPSTLISSKEAELTGIVLALCLYAKTRQIKPAISRLAIFNDNQTVIKNIHDPPSSEPNQNLLLLIKKLMESYQLTSTTTKAKEITKDSLTKGMKLHDSLSSVQEKIKERFSTSQIQFTMKKRLYLTTPARDIWRSLQKLEKSRASIIFQLRSGHIALNFYLFRMGKKDNVLSGNCTTCKVPETPEHFLIRCKRFNQQRRILRQAVKKKKIKTNLSSYTSLINNPKLFFLISEFVLNTKRFKRFKCYANPKGMILIPLPTALS
ncbi:hypothetical protein CROQUDRAFT_663532 [Cronartium quercuum f. sp. fusiforme G11]|uniref:RNase H type-1 domain-containing protein n=1 Tax=Cronartium quercuum f. sp. fusiforme G11 TaxID=708437 RepID=A0A9P6NCE3_9BASI|nr:hypothetical protein CROQUDRAFT_663532 [Cronartium quercuum f. sp. fusiforme G11]